MDTLTSHPDEPRKRPTRRGYRGGRRVQRARANYLARQAEADTQNDA